MISKKQAVAIYDNDDGFTNGDSVEVVYDEIIKSIGSCNKCDDLTTIDGDLWCSVFQAPVEEDGFCCYFNKKETK